MLKKLLGRRPRKPLPEITPPSPFVGYAPVDTDLGPEIAGLGRIETALSWFRNPAADLRKWKALVFTDQGNFENPHVALIDRLATPEHARLRVEFTPMDVCLPVLVHRLAFLSDDGTVLKVQAQYLTLGAGDTLHLSYELNQ